MSAQVVAMRVGAVELLVEVSPVMVAGTQPTSTLGEAASRVLGAFDRAEQAIVEVASSVAATVSRMGATRPDRLEVEFGLKFSIQGDVIVASASGEANLRVLVGYDAARQG